MTGEGKIVLILSRHQDVTVFVPCFSKECKYFSNQGVFKFREINPIK